MALSVYKVRYLKFHNVAKMVITQHFVVIQNTYTIDAIQNRKLCSVSVQLARSTLHDKIHNCYYFIKMPTDTSSTNTVLVLKKAIKPYAIGLLQGLLTSTMSLFLVRANFACTYAYCLTMQYYKNMKLKTAMEAS